MEHLTIEQARALINRALPISAELELFEHWRNCKICREILKPIVVEKAQEKYEISQSVIFWYPFYVGDLQFRVYFTTKYIVAVGIGKRMIFNTEFVQVGWEEVERFHRGFLDSFVKYFISGSPVIYKDILPFFTSTFFSKTVLYWTYLIPHGRTVSYGELAEWVGGRRYSRAVGQALARNKLPILIPCHRVIQAGGKPGNFTAGVEFKVKLLKLEKKYLAELKMGKNDPGNSQTY